MNSIELFFKENLDGNEAYVSSGGLCVEGTIEQKCKMEFKEHYGLICSVPLEYNHIDVVEVIRKNMYEVREANNFNYAVVGDLYQSIASIVKNTYIKIAQIYTSRIINMNVTYREKTVIDCELKYEDGSIVKIRAIKKIKI